MTWDFTPKLLIRPNTISMMSSTCFSYFAWLHLLCQSIVMEWSSSFYSPLRVAQSGAQTFPVSVDRCPPNFSLEHRNEPHFSYEHRNSQVSSITRGLLSVRQLCSQFDIVQETTMTSPKNFIHLLKLLSS